MRIDDLRPTENVDDRRGAFGGYGPHVAFGGGGLGLVAVVVIALLFGVDPTRLLNDAGGGPPATQTQQPGQPRADDAAYQFSRRIIGSAEDIWAPILRAKGVQFTPATFTVYDSETPTGCGEGQAAALPSRCRTIEGKGASVPKWVATRSCRSRFCSAM